MKCRNRVTKKDPAVISNSGYKGLIKYSLTLYPHFIDFSKKEDYRHFRH